MDQAQETFQAFMLAGKGARDNHGASPASHSEVTPRKGAGSKALSPVLKAFQGRLNEWKENDDQLRAVLDSISNLRDRILWESHELQRTLDARHLKPWQGKGKNSVPSKLTSEDITLAQTHDLLQHEKMLIAARGLIANQAKIQDAMSRRLDELMRLQTPGFEKVHSRSVQAQDIYQFCASELLRKQDLIHQVMISSHDGLVATKANFEPDLNPRTVIRKCCIQWTSKDSELKLKLERCLGESWK